MSRRNRRRTRPADHAPANVPPAGDATLQSRRFNRWWIWLGCGALVFAVAWWAVARSGLWGAAETERTADAGVPQFVGRTVCAECHADQVAAWAGSDHDRAMDVATAATVLGNFDNARFTHSGVTSEFFRRDGKFLVRTDGPDGKLADFEIRYVFGVDPLQQYLIEMPDGRLQTLSITWDSRPAAQGGQRWYHMYPGEFVPHGDELHWTGPLQNWNYQCAECHSTNLQRSYDPKSRRHSATWSEIDVSCETCHGPGSRHVAWAKDPEAAKAGDAGTLGLVVRLDERHGVTWKMDPSNGKPARSEPRVSNREIETCARCHSRRGQVWKEYTPGRPIGETHRVALLDPELYFPDGQIRDEVYEYGSFLQSRMHQAGVSCGDCHDPHSLKLRAPVGAVCLQCHQAEKYQAAAHHHHQPESAGSDCLACHMPGRHYMGVDFRRDHSMRVPRPDLAVSLGVPDACTGCHEDRKPAWAAGKLREWFGTARTEARHYALILHDGDIGAAGAREQLLTLAQDNSQPGIVRASALQRVDRIPGPDVLARIAALLQDPDPLVRRAAVSAHRPLPPERRKGLLVMLKDAVRDVRLEAVPLVADIPADLLQPGEIGERDRAMAEYISSQQVNADRADAHLNLALIALARGRPEEARAELEEALVLDSRFVPATVNLADLHRTLGQEGEAEAALRQGLETNPKAAALHHALGLLMVRTGRGDAALDELKLAAELAPFAARYSYVYAVALDGAGRRPEAIRILHRALVQQPNDRDTLWTLASYQLDANNHRDARVIAERLLTLEPDDPDVRALADRAINGKGSP